MDTATLYSDLLEEMAADQAALDKAKEALDEKKELARLLKKRLDVIAAAGGPVPALVPPRATVRPEGGWPFPKGSGTELQQVATSQAKTVDAPMTIAQLVAAAIRLMGERVFVVGDVIPAMRSAGMQMPANLGNAQVTTVLKRLHATGVLERTFTGAGNVPHKYRVATNGVQADLTTNEVGLAS